MDLDVLKDGGEAIIDGAMDGTRNALAEGTTVAVEGGTSFIENLLSGVLNTQILSTAAVAAAAIVAYKTIKGFVLRSKAHKEASRLKLMEECQGNIKLAIAINKEVAKYAGLKLKKVDLELKRKNGTKLTEKEVEEYKKIVAEMEKSKGTIDALKKGYDHKKYIKKGEMRLIKTKANFSERNKRQLAMKYIKHYNKLKIRGGLKNTRAFSSQLDGKYIKNEYNLIKSALGAKNKTPSKKKVAKFTKSQQKFASAQGLSWFQSVDLDGYAYNANNQPLGLKFYNTGIVAKNVESVDKFKFLVNKFLLDQADHKVYSCTASFQKKSKMGDIVVSLNDNSSTKNPVTRSKLAKAIVYEDIYLTSTKELKTNDNVKELETKYFPIVIDENNFKRPHTISTYEAFLTEYKDQARLLNIMESIKTEDQANFSFDTDREILSVLQETNNQNEREDVVPVQNEESIDESDYSYLVRPMLGNVGTVTTVEVVNSEGKTDGSKKEDNEELAATTDERTEVVEGKNKKEDEIKDDGEMSLS